MYAAVDIDGLHHLAAAMHIAARMPGAPAFEDVLMPIRSIAGDERVPYGHRGVASRGPVVGSPNRSRNIH